MRVDEGVSPAQASAQLDTSKRVEKVGRVGEFPGGWKHARSPSSPLLSPLFISPHTDNHGGRERVRWVPWFPFWPESPRWISRPQSCVAGPPGGAGHHCSPAQNHPWEPWCSPTPTRPGALTPPPPLGRYREGRVLVSSPTPLLGLLNSFAFKYYYYFLGFPLPSFLCLHFFPCVFLAVCVLLSPSVSLCPFGPPPPSPTSPNPSLVSFSICQTNFGSSAFNENKTKGS